MKVREFKQILFRNVPRLQQALLEEKTNKRASSYASTLLSWTKR
jgi:hypothetical protein